MLPRRRLLTQWIVIFTLLLVGCHRSTPESLGRLVVGIVSYDTGTQSLDQYQRFQDHLALQTQSIVELEPAYNELQAVQQVRRKTVWSLVFAPPGLAAIAIAEAQYIPLFSLAEVSNLRSLIVVRADSSAQTLVDLANQVIALGEPGSAAGYYLPLYDLYGLTLQEVRFAPTPRTVLEWVSTGEVVAGALSETEYQQHRQEFNSTRFRVLHPGRFVPPGMVLLGSSVDRNQQQLIEAAMREAPGSIVSDAGYLPNAPLPDYDQFIQLVEKVRPLEQRVRQKPAVLTIDSEP